MNFILTPKHLHLRPLARGVLGGALVMGGLAAWPAHAVKSVATNPEPAKRALLLAATCNPCAVKKKAYGGCNPCAAKKAACGACNPCAVKKAACGACNPCAAKKAACGACNPCGGAKVAAKAFKRPCGAGVNPLAVGALAKEGERLWNDTSLSSNGLACNTCHNGHASLNPTFAMVYPHKVAMPAQMAGVNQVHLDEMVQFCMLVPMQAKALDWNSRELAALTAYSVVFQKGYNPCAAKKKGCGACNPCAAKKKGCGACNPCAAKKKS